jgi:hypothetical protein
MTLESIRASLTVVGSLMGDLSYPKVMNVAARVMDLHGATSPLVAGTLIQAYVDSKRTAEPVPAVATDGE